MRPATSTLNPALSPSRGILFAHIEKVEGRMVLGKVGCPCRTPLRIEEQSIMADQRAFGNTDRSPAEVGTQVRDSAQEAGAQVRDKVQEVGTQVRDKAQEVGAQVRDKAQEVCAQVRDKAQEVGTQVRDKAQEVGAQVRDKAQEVGAQVRDNAQEMVRQGKESASDSYQQGRQQMEAGEHTLEDGIRAKPLQSVLIAAGIGMLLGLVLKK